MPGRKKITTAQSIDNISLKDRILNRSRNYYSHLTQRLKRHPLGSFLTVLGLLLLLLIIGRLIAPQPEDKKQSKIIKDVTVYSIGQGPQAAFQAKIEKSGVVQIIAQTAGIVQNISVKAGDHIQKGQQIISLSTNYQGGNASSVQRLITQTQYQNVLDTFDKQNELIQKQRDVATASAENAQQTRDIARLAIGETGSLIDSNQSQLDQMNRTVQTLQQNNPNGANNEQIGALQAGISQLQGGVNQLRQAQRTTEYQASNDKAPALLSTLQKDIALKQLDVQSKSLELNKEVSRLQVNLSYVTEALMYPASPFTGTVERVNVRVGQAINPGMVLATISANNVESTAVLLVPHAIAQVLSLGEPSHLKIDNRSISITPYYIASEATDGQLYAVFYAIPESAQSEVTDGEYITVNVPVGTAKTSSADPLIPIDAVYQTQNSAYVLVAQKDKAISKKVKPANVFGNYVEITNGLSSGDQIILNRNVIAEDDVKIVTE